MPVQITIRNVPEEVRNELASRAAKRHQSMQEYLREELIAIAAQPTIEDWLERVRERVTASGTELTAEEIVAHVKADRR
jgi:plasmid stability protein